MRPQDDANQQHESAGNPDMSQGPTHQMNEKPRARGDKVDWEARLAQEFEDLNPEEQGDVDARIAAILEKNRIESEIFAKKSLRASWYLRVWFSMTALGLLALLVIVCWTYRDRIVQDWDRYDSPVSTCVFKVGERTMHATREKSYRYYTVLGWRFYDTRLVQEKTFVDMPNNAGSVLAHMADGTHPKVSVKDAEPGRYPLPNAESYSFFLDNGKNSEVVTYKEMCK